MLHKITVNEGVYEVLLVATRLLKNTEDKALRDKYKLTEKHLNPYFPLSMAPAAESEEEMTINNSSVSIDEDINPLFTKIVEIAK